MHRSTVGSGIFPQELLYHSGSFRQSVASAVTVYNGEYMTGFQSHFGTFVVAGGSAYAACQVTVYGKPFDIQRSASDTLERFFRTPDAEFKVVSLYLVCVKTAYGVSGTKGDKVDEVYQRVNPCLLYTSDAADE